ncbi:mitogen-activated protein kinase kinase kinase 5 [Prunus yedoensis var. nudiflora]|uniref:Mitogen-activated protein kinase kinase kinase 5 n=1 Tax=Prunus yedoensis var. nudiflora TaxID=2094558 RepID=A0A314XH10_PRUYE|nr:mitogen-activated protein kinase kinase kinase 5 [Prunus yedoensis var. nudiflora]PQP93094.1 mitogen-activated protein kinase kinase kinase 5 [Prunus yedoensis var. nudiflora]
MEALFLRSYERALRFLLLWALGCLVVEIESGKPIWDHSLGVNIFKLLMRKLWTADMLLSHPFVSDYDTVLVEDKGELSFGGSPSPRGNFDFPDWVSMASYEISQGFGDFPDCVWSRVWVIVL